ncbi:BTB/POZ domain-containing protein [Hirschfeldia incana]|nr:BTB/POZ domain-containing protein [Hirschfeldia incana]
MATETNKDVYSSGYAKILKQKWHTDLRLKAGDSNDFADISAHKLVLAARSDVFKKMPESEVTKASSDHETLNFSEMRHEELEILVEFMYNDHGSVSSSKLKKHVRSLYLAAERYEIPHLRDLCRNELISSLSSSNALYVLELSQVPLDEPLNDAVLSFIARNIHTFLDSIEFKMFVARNPNLAVEITKAFLNPVTIPFESDDDDDY